MGWLEFVILSLATWRLSHMLSLETGPGQVFRRFRSLAGIRESALGQRSADTLPAQLLDCPLCTSVWVGAGSYLVFAFLPDSLPVFTILALSGVASALQLGISR